MKAMDFWDKLGEMYDDPQIALWGILSVPYSGILYMVCYPQPISTFYLFMALMTVCWLAAYPRIFKDAASSTPDWNEEPDNAKISLWVIVGLIGLFIVSFIMALGSNLQFWQTPAFWVPTNLTPLSTIPPTENNVLWIFTVNMFGTWMAVVSGEESLKCLFAVLWKAYGRFDWAETIPFALQPFWLAGVGFWAALHVIAGQNPPIFAVNVFICGILMGEAAAESGSYTTAWLIHALFNSIILVAAFLSGGYFSILVR